MYWDGDRRLSVTLRRDLVLIGSDVNLEGDSNVLASVGDSSFIVRLPPEDDDPNAVSSAHRAAYRAAGAQPVFLSESGTLMVLPGGVVVLFDEAWTRAQATRFFAAEGVPQARVTELALRNAYLVETDPGLPSLHLANRLAQRPGVDVASPNWWRSTKPF